MDLQEIESRVESIRAIAEDDEAAHAEEDSLYQDFIEYVASLDDLPLLSHKALVVLRTSKIDFARWCA